MMALSFLCSDSRNARNRRFRRAFFISGVTIVTDFRTFFGDSYDDDDEKEDEESEDEESDDSDCPDDDDSYSPELTTVEDTLEASLVDLLEDILKNGKKFTQQSQGNSNTVITGKWSLGCTGMPSVMSAQVRVRMGLKLRAKIQSRVWLGMRSS